MFNGKKNNIQKMLFQRALFKVLSKTKCKLIYSTYIKCKFNYHAKNFFV